MDGFKDQLVNELSFHALILGLIRATSTFVLNRNNILLVQMTISLSGQFEKK